jgi:hypothetical protein
VARHQGMIRCLADSEQIQGGISSLLSDTGSARAQNPPKGSEESVSTKIKIVLQGADPADLARKSFHDNPAL